MFTMVSSRLIIQLSLSTDWNNSIASPYSVKSFSEPFNNISILHMHELSGLTVPCNGFKTNIFQQLQRSCELEVVYSLFQWGFSPVHNCRELLSVKNGPNSQRRDEYSQGKEIASLTYNRDNDLVWTPTHSKESTTDKWQYFVAMQELTCLLSFAMGQYSKQTHFASQ